MDKTTTDCTTPAAKVKISLRFFRFSPAQAMPSKATMGVNKAIKGLTSAMGGESMKSTSSEGKTVGFEKSLHEVDHVLVVDADYEDHGGG